MMLLPRSLATLAVRALSGLTVSAGLAHAQAAPTVADLRPAARLVIEAARYATFVTLDEAGRPRSRTVQPVAPDSGFVVWFATNPRTRKVADIARDPRVTLHWFDPASLAYVSIAGRARVVRNRAEKDRHWQAAWSGYYPDRDTSVVLVEVVPERLEMVDIKRDVEGDKATWRPPAMSFPRRAASPKKR